MRGHRTSFVIGLVLAASGAEAAAPEVSPTTIEMRGSRAEPLTATFTVRHAPSDKVRLVAGDLHEVTRRTALVGIKATSAVELTETDSVVERVTVTVPVPPKAGTFTGTVTVQQVGSTEKPADVSVTAVFDPIPSVDTDLSSKSVVFHLTKGAATAGYHEVILLQAGEGEFTVDDATPSVMKRGDRPLPLNALSVLPSRPVNSRAGSMRLGLIATPAGARSGEYEGSLHVRVAGQDRRVEVPVKVRIKDGPILPLLVLVAGVISAAFLGWWNSGASAIHGIARDARRLEASVRAAEGLQKRERERCYELVQAVLQSVELGQPVAECQARLQRAQEAVEKARADAEAVLQRLRDLDASVNSARAAVRIQSDMGKGVLDLFERVRDGELSDLGQATGETEALESQVNALQAVLKRFAELPADKRNAIVDEVAAATSVQELERLVSTAAGPAAAAKTGVAKRPAPKAPWLPRGSRERLLRAGAIGVGALTYVFVLVVGWLSIYVESATFGAEAMQYVTLFLWGATVETVRGKAVTMQALQGLVPGRPGT